VLSKRTDNQYWLDNRETQTIPTRLQQLLALWQYQEPTFNDFTEIEEVFPAASYQYILYGMGFVTQARTTKRRYDNTDTCQKNLADNQQLSQKYLAGLPSNRALIDYLTQNKVNAKANT
jgi:hypothetical protein